MSRPHCLPVRLPAADRPACANGRQAHADRHMVCFPYAFLTHITITGEGEKGNMKYKADRSSTATLQNELRRIVWDDLT